MAAGKNIAKLAGMAGRSPAKSSRKHRKGRRK